MKIRLSIGFVLFLLLLLSFAISTSMQPKSVTVPSPDNLSIRLTKMKDFGGRVDWGPNNLIVFDKAGPDGFYDVYTMRTDGTGETCLTCGKGNLIPQKHNGNPAWHPSGKYIVFQAEKAQHRGNSVWSKPGSGAVCDLWLMTADGTQFFKLVDVPDSPDAGMLHPHFSADGKMLSWSRMVVGARLFQKGREFGTYQLKVADFAIQNGSPRLSNIRIYAPKGATFHENHGFSPDGKLLLFTAGTIGAPMFQNANIYTIDISSRKLTQLTKTGYNEHATFAPDNQTIIWMSNRDNANKGCDYWIMDRQGQAKQRATFMNVKGHPHFQNQPMTAADISFDPTGTRAMAYVQTDLIKQVGKIFLLENTDAMSGGPTGGTPLSALVKSIKVLDDNGGRLSLSPDAKTIAYDKRGSDKYFDVWTMSADGSNKKCLTCNHPTLPKRNVGQPAWHPSGNYLVVQVEKEKHHEGIASGLSANPGAGIYNDLWIIEYRTNRAWLAHEVPQGKQHGVLHPHFSPDGKRLSWSQSYQEVQLSDPARLAGSWKLKVADVAIDQGGVMSLKNIQTFQPGDDVFYENHGFSPDGRKLIFTSNLKGDQSLFTSDIYTLDIVTQHLTRLTTEGYNEHAQYSPNGKKIIWMSTNGNIEPAKVKEVAYTDWWIMNADSSDKKRLTYLNQKGHPHFAVWGTVAADFDWLPGSDGFIGYYHTATLQNILTGKFKEVVVAVELN